MKAKDITTAADAIARSIRHCEIVTIPYDAEIAIDLLVEREDSADSTDVMQYWGTDDAGDEWRVHLEQPQIRQDEDDDV